MPFLVSCPACKSGFNAPDHSAGKRVHCTHCNALLEIPSVENQKSPNHAESEHEPGPAKMVPPPIRTQAPQEAEPGQRDWALEPKLADYPLGESDLQDNADQAQTPSGSRAVTSLGIVAFAVTGLIFAIPLTVVVVVACWPGSSSDRRGQKSGSIESGLVPLEEDNAAELALLVEHPWWKGAKRSDIEAFVSEASRSGPSVWWVGNSGRFVNLSAWEQKNSAGVIYEGSGRDPEDIKRWQKLVEAYDKKKKQLEQSLGSRYVSLKLSGVAVGFSGDLSRRYTTKEVTILLLANVEDDYFQHGRK